MVRNNDKPWFTSKLRTEIRRIDRFRKIVLKSKTESSILRYKQQRNKVNNIKRNAKENIEKNLNTIMLENASNSNEYWKLKKMLIKSN
jgi:transcriptional regulator